MPDPNRVLALVRRSAMLTRATPGREGAIVSLPAEAVDDVLVVGDLHGNVTAFRKVLALADLKGKPRRHLVLQELVHGDYSYPDDGGDKSHQLLDLVCALKCEYPDRVHLILGNHELSELTGRAIGKNGVALNALFRKGVETAYGAMAEAIIAAYHELFRSLPLAVRCPNRVFLCHTLPDGSTLDELDLEPLRTGVFTPESMGRGGAVYALTWGRDDRPETADRFAGMVDADWFITGHQPCDESFRVANHRLLIIDGTGPYPACCLFPANEPVTIEALRDRVRVIDLAEG
ncbi:metallophosphoesterase family protein [Tautonia sociabilis]|uniref:Serine/threonine protein phosphatase n=1 Tax=Tautonia sociabilis TaxID=2080755 RepID=A0A432MKV8_9BACT|nr:metallophosphoesterase family protein [Tautonia sociabilis]RUL87899.1 serine/threonine protein phosphatase [Tautonia sociabilis]